MFDDLVNEVAPKLEEADGQVVLQHTFFKAYEGRNQVHGFTADGKLSAA